MSVDKDWLLNRRNVSRIRMAADNAAEDPNIPDDLQRYFIDLEQAARTLERELAKHGF